MIVLPVLKMLTVTSFMSFPGLNLILTAEYLRERRHSLSGVTSSTQSGPRCAPVRIKGDAGESSRRRKQLRGLHEVDGVVEAEVRVDHHYSRLITRELVELEDDLDDGRELSEDSVTVGEARAPA
jgi:hypothetical protein